jgi:aryl-alcohol dehydrogenase-like predicted oxidoreductase
MTPSEKVSKLAIGSVQFGLEYGISNNHGQTKSDEVEKILQLAISNGINTLDTAHGYGSSEETLGNFNLEKWDIVSKFSEASDNVSLRKSLKESLKRLGVKNLHGYIAHSASLLIENPGLWTILKQFKSEGLVKKIGYSLYHLHELERLLENDMIPDLVQLPYNIVDNRFSSRLPMLKDYGTEIHTRSAFLQGIFFMDYKKLNSHFGEIIPFLKDLDSKFNTPESKAGFLLNYCLQNPYIDKVVIGVNISEQLEQNIQSLNNQLPSTALESIPYISEKILIPVNWPQN